jgi:hypothetical protein
MGILKESRTQSFMGVDLSVMKDRSISNRKPRMSLWRVLGIAMFAFVVIGLWPLSYLASPRWEV